MELWDTIIIGAGAAGLFCAGRAAATGKRTLLIDHAKRPGEKIRIAGGGRCNFTNLYCEPGNFLGANPHFHKSALARFTQWDFIALVDAYGIAWHEKTLGQLFCDEKATQIVDMLLSELDKSGAQLRLNTPVIDITHGPDGFRLTLPSGPVQATNLVLATGGKSIPKMGATGLAYDVARQFGHSVTDTRPALVPLTFPEGRFAAISGVSTPVRISHGTTAFDEAMLFTHRGLSGPAVLQISSYWREGDAITVNLDPEGALFDALRAQRQQQGRRNLTTELSRHLPARLVDHLAPTLGLTGNLADQSDTRLREIVGALSTWQLTPNGSEGYRTAEVTLGGVDTTGIDSKTMMSKTLPGLYFIGECLDVTGWLGGFNFQWAWSSAQAAARHIADS